MLQHHHFLLIKRKSGVGGGGRWRVKENSLIVNIQKITKIITVQGGIEGI